MAHGGVCMPNFWVDPGAPAMRFNLLGRHGGASWHVCCCASQLVYLGTGLKDGG
jgi:hypothetical protein